MLIFSPLGRPVWTSITERLLEPSLSTYSALISHAGAMWWGIAPTAKWSMTLNVRGSITSTVPPVLLGTYTRGGSSQRGHGTTPDIVFAYTFIGAAGSATGWTSGAGSRRAGSVSAATVAGCVTAGVVHTTASTTPAGLTMTSVNTMAKATRTARDRTSDEIDLLVREIFELRCELTHPPPVVQAAYEPSIALVSCHVQKLLLRDQRPEPGQVRISAVAHDAADNPGELAPLAF